MPRQPSKKNELNPTLCKEALAVCACSNLRAATRAVTKLFDDALAPVGLRATQLVILLAIAEKKGQTIAEISGRLRMDASTLNRNLSVLKKRGMAVAKPLYGQRKFLSLSNQGIRTVKTAIPLWQSTQSAVVGRFGKQKFRDFLADLSELTTAVDKVRD